MIPRIFLAAALPLGLSSSAGRQIHALDGGTINNSVNFSQFVITRGWNGLVAEGLVGIDGPKDRLDTPAPARFHRFRVALPQPP